MRQALLVLALAFAGAAHAAPEADFFESRPAFAEPEGQPREMATCETLAEQLPDRVDEDRRIDLHVRGPVTLIQTDGALWYLAICAAPGVRILCVTSAVNDLKLGDHAALGGAYRREDERHVRLDPCLARPTP